MVIVNARRFPGRVTRRAALQVGAIGLGMAELSMLTARAAETATPKAKSVIFVFLTGGLSQHDALRS